MLASLGERQPILVKVEPWSLKLQGALFCTQSTTRRSPLGCFPQWLLRQSGEQCRNQISTIFRQWRPEPHPWWGGLRPPLVQDQCAATSLSSQQCYKILVNVKTKSLVFPQLDLATMPTTKSSLSPRMMECIVLSDSTSSFMSHTVSSRAYKYVAQPVTFVLHLNAWLFDKAYCKCGRPVTLFRWFLMTFSHQKWAHCGKGASTVLSHSLSLSTATSIKAYVVSESLSVFRWIHSWLVMSLAC